MLPRYLPRTTGPTISCNFDLGFSTNGPQPRIDSTYQITDSFSKVIGKHTLKFGYDGKRINNTDLVLSKRVIFTEKRFLELRLEGYNVFNHTQFSTSAAEGGSGVVGDFNSANFGRILSAAPGRTVQLAGKFYF